MIDVSVAFLQSDAYGPDEVDRYVSLRSYPGGPVHLFKLSGPTYGQRSAPRRWYLTLSNWLVSEGYVRGKNDPCLYVHPSGHTIVTWVDDLLCRGSLADSVDFFNRLGMRFDCKDPEFLELGGTMTFTGLDISRECVGGRDWYYLSQLNDMQEFLHSSGLVDEKQRDASRDAPMSNRQTALSDTGELTESERSWCRSVIGELNHFSRTVKWDIAHAVSRVSQWMRQPVTGTIAALKQVGGFLHKTAGFRIAGCRRGGADCLTVHVDSDHHGDRNVSTKSHTGVTVLLNGTPIFWRSNKQQLKTALSPAEAEVYAMSEGCRDARDIAWTLEEMGCDISWPLKIITDSNGAYSFQKDNVPKSKLRGCIDRRDDWVAEVQDAGSINAEWISGEENMANIMTKCLTPKQYLKERQVIIDMQSCPDFE